MFNRALLFLFIIPLFYACAEDQKTCSYTSDCPSDQKCVNSVCTKECRETRDCSGGLFCVMGKCQNLDKICDSSADCNQGQSCEGGVCISTGLGNTVNTGSQGSGQTGSGQADNGRLDYGSSCTLNPQCKSNICAGEDASSLKYCTRMCVQDSECSQGAKCMSVSSLGGRACVFSQSSGNGGPAGGLPLGSQCNSNSTCQSGLSCFSIGNNNSICSNECISNSNCGSGYECSGASSANGSFTTACIPSGGGGRGSIGQSCSAGSDCASTYCISAASSVGYCTVQCYGNNCPDGYSCVNVGNGNGGQVKMCVLNTKGVRNRRCTQDLDCVDIGGLCDDMYEARCIGYCNSDSDCTSYYPVCNPMTKRCGQCISSFDCPSNSTIGCYPVADTINICL